MHEHDRLIAQHRAPVVTKELIAGGAATGFVSGLAFRLADHESNAFEALCKIFNISDNVKIVIDAVNHLAQSSNSADIRAAEIINSLSTGVFFAIFGALAGTSFAISKYLRDNES